MAKKDDEINVTPIFENIVTIVIISLLIIIIAMLWLEKDFTFIEIVPKPEQRFVCECQCNVPLCKEESTDWDGDTTWYWINSSAINGNNLPVE